MSDQGFPQDADMYDESRIVGVSWSSGGCKAQRLRCRLQTCLLQHLELGETRLNPTLGIRALSRPSLPPRRSAPPARFTLSRVFPLCGIGHRAALESPPLGTPSSPFPITGWVHAFLQSRSAATEYPPLGTLPLPSLSWVGLTAFLLSRSALSESPPLGTPSLPFPLVRWVGLVHLPAPQVGLTGGSPCSDLLHPPSLSFVGRARTPSCFPGWLFISVARGTESFAFLRTRLACFPVVITYAGSVVIPSFGWRLQKLVLDCVILAHQTSLVGGPSILEFARGQGVLGDWECQLCSPR
ncbi:hypothetical protein DFP72DRAFT_847160 [Ephemerocybe angulata]|uniref:Uncharacterized protein n=1 Tax=Ephemerocybe angulata TaxID=980116 RepID=A0A8H6M507_9AGAR|nr:hypothetical protein DFP72DRAFT_847160 [Tulosesus angulatus]